VNSIRGSARQLKVSPKDPIRRALDYQQGLDNKSILDFLVGYAMSLEGMQVPLERDTWFDYRRSGAG